MRGYFGVAVYHPKNEINIGSLWRTAQLLGADFLATIGRRYKQQASDTMKSTRHLPLFHHADFEAFKLGLPADCLLVGVELVPSAPLLADFEHPERAVYLLGAEDTGLPAEVMRRCHRMVRLPGERSLNLAVAGSIVVYDRVAH